MPTAVSFSSSSSSSSSCRHIGATAQTKNAVLGLTRLLPGEVDTTTTTNDNVNVNDNDALIFGKFEINHDDNTVNGMDYHSGSTTTTTSLSSFSASALLAMLLGKVRSNVESTLARITTGDSNNNNNNNNNNTGDQEDHDAKMKVDYILEFDIVVPPETSTEARIGLLDAAYAAGLSRARIVESAVAYQACYQRKFPETTTTNTTTTAEEEKDGTTRVLVVDMGKTQTTVAVLGHKPEVMQKEEEEEETPKVDDEEGEAKEGEAKTLASTFTVLSAVQNLGCRIRGCSIVESFSNQRSSLERSFHQKVSCRTSPFGGYEKTQTFAKSIARRRRDGGECWCER